MKLNLMMAIIAMLFSSVVSAEVTAAFRAANAVVLYEFNETDNTVRDTANPAFGAPINLSILDGSAVSRSPGVLHILNSSRIVSTGPATKLYKQCSTSNEMTIEISLENSESVIERSGKDDNNVLQPLRIVSYSSGLKKRNFTIGQVYDAGNMYSAAVTNSSDGGNSLREPLESSTDAILAPNEMDLSTYPQTIIVSYKRNMAKMYLTDKDGTLFLHKTTAINFTGDFSTWDPNAQLSLGNEIIADTSFLNYNTQFKVCDPKKDNICGKNPNRFWKGKLRRVAIYCKALDDEKEIFGANQFQVITNPVFPINTNLQITPELQRAQEIHQRITGVKTPLVNPVLSQMANSIKNGDPLSAAALATSDPNFLNITVRDFAAKMSNRDETINVPLNDFTATVIGAIRDNLDARKLLTDNIVYVADPTKASVPNNLEVDIIKSNNHYEALSNQRFDLAKVLMPSTQKMWDGKSVVPMPIPAGLLTTRQWLAAHTVAGTNRRAVEYTFREFLCTPIEKVADSNGPDDVVGRDIDRFPGGSHSKYTTTCRACHTVMDGFRGAYGHLTFSANMVKHGLVSPAAATDGEEARTAGLVQNPPFIAKKMNHNETVFPEGRIIVDDRWWNNAVLGANATTFGWSATRSGKGIQEFGKLVSSSKQFPKCMAQRVFKSVCKREPASSDQTLIDSAASEFSSSKSYNLKYLFQRIVTSKECLGGQ